MIQSETGKSKRIVERAFVQSPEIPFNRPTSLPILANSSPLCIFLPSQKNAPDFQGLGNGTQVDNNVLQTFQNNFVEVQNILDQNRLLIIEINQNHESKIPDNLGRNVGLIRELNNNIRRVVDLYADLSTSFTKSMETSSQGDSGGTLKSEGRPGQKRIRPV
ncbi:hypothetical protein HHK36_005957 [Tetracentron sinense]|uniref:Protein EARLY FLOWERING 4 domain-containing protein n=1 Tax=Tetracentron sinense TaxID=13715 RepID=A0A834ZNI5_TETSI|nr:hypothetical protein HHK36_005957 [Tetracentron sinense]